MRRAFEIFDHTADIGIIAYGADIKQVFSNAALALFSLITEPESVEQTLYRDFEISSEDRETLLVEWLNELIYLFDAEQLVFSRFDIKDLTENQLQATCYGEYFKPGKHKAKMGIKAATYHMLKLEKDNDGYKARIIFDI
jgi:SHS2 domain-containing protein